MKYLLSILFVFSAFFLQAQNIFKSIAAQDLSSITRLLGEETDLCLLDDQEILSKNEVVKKLSSFLATIKPKSCEKVHSGNSVGNRSNYSLGKLITADNQAYRVFIFAEEDETIKEIRIDRW